MSAVSKREAIQMLREVDLGNYVDFWEKHGPSLTDGKIHPAVHMGNNGRTNRFEGNPNGRPHHIFEQTAHLFGGDVPPRRS